MTKGGAPRLLVNLFLSLIKALDNTVSHKAYVVCVGSAIIESHRLPGHTPSAVRVQACIRSTILLEILQNEG